MNYAQANQGFGTFYDVQSNLPTPYTQNSASHHGHPWPGLLETAGTTDDAKAFVKKNGLYLAGGGLVVLGLAAWKFGWFE